MYPFPETEAEWYSAIRENGGMLRYMPVELIDDTQLYEALMKCDRPCGVWIPERLLTQELVEHNIKSESSYSFDLYSSDEARLIWKVGNPFRLWKLAVKRAPKSIIDAPRKFQHKLAWIMVKKDPKWLWWVPVSARSVKMVRYVLARNCGCLPMVTWHHMSREMLPMVYEWARQNPLPDDSLRENPLTQTPYRFRNREFYQQAFSYPELFWLGHARSRKTGKICRWIVEIAMSVAPDKNYDFVPEHLKYLYAQYKQERDAQMQAFYRDAPYGRCTNRPLTGRPNMPFVCPIEGCMTQPMWWMTRGYCPEHVCGEEMGSDGDCDIHAAKTGDCPRHRHPRS